jgi:hypothetical protein
LRAEVRFSKKRARSSHPAVRIIDYLDEQGLLPRDGVRVLFSEEQQFGGRRLPGPLFADYVHGTRLAPKWMLRASVLLAVAALDLLQPCPEAAQTLRSLALDALRAYLGGAEEHDWIVNTSLRLRGCDLSASS